ELDVEAVALAGLLVVRDVDYRVARLCRCIDVARAGELAVCAGPSSGCTATDCEQQPEHHGKHKARWTTPSIQHATSPPKLERLQHGGARRRPAGLRAAHPTEHRPETVRPWARRTALRSARRDAKANSCAVFVRAGWTCHVSQELDEIPHR